MLCKRLCDVVNNMEELDKESSAIGAAKNDGSIPEIVAEHDEPDKSDAKDMSVPPTPEKIVKR